jgi:MmyB-like transcription regulator ligand binding domain
VRPPSSPTGGSTSSPPTRSRAACRPTCSTPASRRPTSRYCFFEARSRSFYDSWPAVADVTVAILRTEAGRDPHDRALTDLVGELATRSEEFRTRWARHDVRLHQQGTKLFHHPVVGDLALDYNAVPLPADPGLSMACYTAQPGSPSAEKLALLASWAATPREAAPGSIEQHASGPLT